MEKSNIYDALALQRSILEKTGCWPKRSKSISYRMLEITFWAVDLLFIAMLFMEANLNLKENDYKNLTMLMAHMASYCSYLMKHVIFVLNANNFLDTLDSLKSPIFKQYPNQCDSYIKSSIKYTTNVMKFYQGIVGYLLMLYVLRPFLMKDKLAMRFDVYQLGHWWFPVHCFQIWAITSACVTHTTVDLTAISLISIGAAQFRILHDKLLNLQAWAGLSYEEIENGACSNIEEMREDIDRQIQKRLEECVQHHYAIIEYCDALENIYCYYFLVQCMTSVVAICNTWFQFQLATDTLTIAFMVIYSVALMLQLGMLCFYGNNLTDMSAEIKDACYMSDWYNCGISVRKSLIIIMERSKRPTVLTAGKFSVIGLASYSNVLQSAYSYFTLMSNINRK